jgi:hypothetical protein
MLIFDLTPSGRLQMVTNVSPGTAISTSNVNGRQTPTEGVSLQRPLPRRTIAYQMLLCGLVIHHGNTSSQITPKHFMRGSFMHIFDLTPDGRLQMVTNISPGTGTSISNSNLMRCRGGDDSPLPGVRRQDPY